jgi:uncharacterized LabA/DUF88 family protein
LYVKGRFGLFAWDYENQALYTALQKDGYILVFKPILKLPSGKVKGSVDAEMVLHAMVEYENYDKALIVTGDGDLYCLVGYLAKNDKLLKLLIPNRNSFSSLFRKMIPYSAFMNDLRGKLAHKRAGRRKKRGIAVEQVTQIGPSS